MLRKSVTLISLALLLVFALVLVLRDQPEPLKQGQVVVSRELSLPTLSDASYDWIGSRIYQNEAMGKAEYLTHWNEGEDFPSMGIGHFIWFPEGVDAPFDEQFPDMVFFLRQQSLDNLKEPVWLQSLDPLVAPWGSKAQFDEARSSVEMTELRTWLEETRQYQARFIVSTFEKRWRNLDLSAEQKQEFSQLLQQLIDTPEGLFAVIDYYNFKGLGNNPRERYQGEGWGLVQVLTALSALRADAGIDACPDIVKQFRDSAAARLSLRVELSAAERKESRWLPGWLKRLDGYLLKESGPDRFGDCGFRVRPYLQNPAQDAITLIWFSNEDRAGKLMVWESAGADNQDGVVFESKPVEAKALVYHPAENCAPDQCNTLSLPYLHQLRVTDLQPGTLYRYEVSQDIESASGSFTTTDDEAPLRIIVYADSETEPESTGKHALWTGDTKRTASRRYLVDQTTGYAQNLKVIQQRDADFIAIAGDLVQSGGEQRDWDEFWLHNAELAASTVIVPALGNHDYFGGPGELGKYETEASERAVRKYQSYFDLPDNGAKNAAHSERYYALKYGVVTLVVLDPTDGLAHQSEQDTNWRLRGENDGGVAPDWHPGSEQYEWLVNQLEQAQETSKFTFVMFHAAPYSSGVHARSPGEKKQGRDILSSKPLQSLTPLFMRYGVDAVFSGHDEMYEHSVVAGVEKSPGGIYRDHEIHFLDVGIGGDGLRGPVKDVTNPYRVFLAHADAPEIYGPDGVLSDGGKHYGHLEINVKKDANGQWQAQMDPVYIFPLLNTQGQVIDFERRLYDDSFTLHAKKLE
jgi:3',5'-cyclic AMP phosphodiesterase CpdA